LEYVGDEFFSLDDGMMMQFNSASSLVPLFLFVSSLRRQIQHYSLMLIRRQSGSPHKLFRLQDGDEHRSRREAGDGKNEMKKRRKKAENQYPSRLGRKRHKSKRYGARAGRENRALKRRINGENISSWII
jgi:hypothetical protein